MVQIKPEYECIDEEAKKLAKEVIDKYPEVFVNKPMERVHFLAITNKTRKETHKRMYDLVPVKGPVSLDCPYGLYVVLWMNDWNSLPDKNKLVLISDILFAFDESEDGFIKVNPPDRVYRETTNTFGDTEFVCRDDIPDILNDANFKWDIR